MDTFGSADVCTKANLRRPVFVVTDCRRALENIRDHVITLQAISPVERLWFTQALTAYLDGRAPTLDEALELPRTTTRALRALKVQDLLVRMRGELPEEMTSWAAAGWLASVISGAVRPSSSLQDELLSELLKLPNYPTTIRHIYRLLTDTKP